MLKALLRTLTRRVYQDKQNAKIADNEYYNNTMRGRETSTTFVITPAIGGKIVLVSYYNNISMCNQEKVYIIPDSEDFRESISEILLMESISR